WSRVTSHLSKKVYPSRVGHTLAFFPGQIVECCAWNRWLLQSRQPLWRDIRAPFATTWIEQVRTLFRRLGRMRFRSWVKWMRAESLDHLFSFSKTSKPAGSLSVH